MVRVSRGSTGEGRDKEGAGGGHVADGVDEMTAGWKNKRFWVNAFVLFSLFMPHLHFPVFSWIFFGLYFTFNSLFECRLKLKHCSVWFLSFSILKKINGFGHMFD